MGKGIKMRFSVKIIASVLCLSILLGGCGNSTVSADLTLAQTDIGAITVSEDVCVVGLGEASHCVKEYQELKAEVFKALVQNNGCRTFVIEGDFGSALKVDDYIHGGEGTAKEAAAVIGFRIYRTREMEELIEWMRTYNETAKEGEDLHFYGMDMQWADNSKEYVFRILEQAAPAVCAAYEADLAFLNDEDMFDISAEAFGQGMSMAESLIQEVDGAKDGIVEVFGNEGFAFARECAVSIYNCCNIRKSDQEYNEVRDSYMAEKVKWLMPFSRRAPIMPATSFSQTTSGRSSYSFAQSRASS
ncbi:MAG: erythromycin esterase family protein [Acetatifactor sp.]|nr:erythromycin esterase family protein [Acetatifactor sp.]